MIHKESHGLAGQTVKIKADDVCFGGAEYIIEDWHDIVMKISWKHDLRNPACLDYAVRAAKGDLPIDNEVLYGKIGLYGKLIHISQIAGYEYITLK